MSKSELLQQLETLSRHDLDEVADRVDELRSSDVSLTPAEKVLLRERSTAYRQNPQDVIDLDDAVAEILNPK